MERKHRQKKDNLPINFSDVKHYDQEEDVIAKSSFSLVAINH